MYFWFFVFSLVWRVFEFLFYSTSLADLKQNVSVLSSPRMYHAAYLEGFGFHLPRDSIPYHAYFGSFSSLDSEFTARLIVAIDQVLLFFSSFARKHDEDEKRR